MTTSSSWTRSLLLHHHGRLRRRSPAEVLLRALHRVEPTEQAELAEQQEEAEAVATKVVEEADSGFQASLSSAERFARSDAVKLRHPCGKTGQFRLSSKGAK